MSSRVALEASRIRVEPVMGTAVSLRIAASAPGSDLDEAMTEAVDWLHEVHDRFTTFDPDSEWMRHATGRLELDDAHPDIRHVAHTCQTLTDRTGGMFSLTPDLGRPPDPAAYVKGWALQRAAEMLSMRGADRVIVNGGGDVVVAGGGEACRIGIQDPSRPDRVVAVVALTRGAVATSGTSERGGHIIDPTSGRSARHWASTTVVGPDLGLADAYATAAFAMGRAALEWLAGLESAYRGYLVDRDDRTYAVGW